MSEHSHGVLAIAEKPAQPPQQDESEPINQIVLENPVLQGKEAHRKLFDYRYHLEAPVFTGNENLEQLIQEFSDVVAVTQ